MSDPYALELQGITKRFGRTVALDHASLHVRRGTVHALLGENGAGKTTLMRIVYGMLRPDEGRMLLDGRPAAPRSTADALARGVGMVHQHFMNVPAMSVAENVALGQRGHYDSRRTAERVREVSSRLGLTLDPAARVADLGVGAQQRLEIVKALARDARLLILDEPTAVLAPQEADELLHWLRRFADAGHTIVLITHKLREALAVADAVSVLRGGRVVLSAERGEVSESSLAASMLGTGVRMPEPPATTASVGDAVIVARALTLRDTRGVERVRDASLVVRRGEILGVVGVEGSGHQMLLRALAGRVAPASGELVLPADVGFIPEDRHRDALVLDFTLVENVALGSAGGMRGIVHWPAWRARTAAVLREFDVRTPREATDAKAGALSGGNQQKLVLGRELRATPPAIVAENPTRGLDLRATAAVHQRLRAARDQGVAIVLHSSDLDEVLSLATRVVAVHAGRVIPAPLDRDAVGRAMLGAT